MPIATRAFAATAADKPLTPYRFDRRDPGPDDVLIDVKYCGVCHSDLHAARSETGRSTYPLVPGHEIAGVVKAVGANVTRFKAGDRVGVGCMVDSCRECASCQEGVEQYCVPGFTGTYGGKDKKGGTSETITQGGYSDHITVDQHFVLSIPDSLALDVAAPLLCAGITTYSPLKEWGVGPGSRVAVIGLGGLGHMAVKLAAAMGAEVTVLSTSNRKKADAERMGAKHFLINSDKDAMKAAAEKFDLIINTVSATHEIASHIQLLARDGTMIMLGLTTEGLPVFALPLLWRRRRIAGSLIGGIRETQEMLDFCARHGIACDIETIAPDQINEAYERMEKSDVRYRFVIDMEKLARLTDRNATEGETSVASDSRLARVASGVNPEPRQGLSKGRQGTGDDMARVAFVTGGTRGIGKAIVQRLHEDGFKVAAGYSGNDEAAKAIADALDVMVVKGNVGSFDDCARAVKEVEDQLGPIDILVNNAGITRDGFFHKMSHDQWSDVIRVNMDSVFNMTRQVINGMRDRGHGRIVNISSINGQKGQIGQTNYSAAKAGMIGFTKALALENARKGVTVNCIAPGYIDTEMVGAMDPKVLEGIISHIPVGRLGKGEEIADMVSWLVGERAGYVTGCTLSLNGGQYLVG